MRRIFLRLWALLLVFCFLGCHGIFLSVQETAQGYLRKGDIERTWPPVPTAPLTEETLRSLSEEAQTVLEKAEAGTIENIAAYQTLCEYGTQVSSSLNLALVQADSDRETADEALLQLHEEVLSLLERSLVLLSLSMDESGERPLTERERQFQTKTKAIHEEPFLTFKRQERASLNAYERVMEETTVLYDGTEWTWERLMNDETLPFPEWERLCLQYEDACLEKYASVLGELVAIRNGMAKELGVENAREGIYQREWRAYTPKQASDYCNAVLTEIGAWYQKTVQAVAGDLTAFWIADVYPLTETLARIEKLLTERADWLLPSFYAMTKEGYGTLTKSDLKSQACYTTYFGEVSMPYTFLAWDDGAAMPITLLHELGHFYQLYKNPSASLALHASKELTELDAYGLEQLFYPHLEQLYGRRAEEARIALTMDAVYGLLHACRSELFLERVYTEKWDTNTLSEWYLSLSWWDAGAEETDWSRLARLYYEPFSEIPIAVAISGGLEFQMYAETHFQKAVQAYQRLVERGEDAPLTQTMEQMGLEPPVTERSVAVLLQLLERRAETWAGRNGDANE